MIERKITLLVLISSFCFQSVLIYFDPAGKSNRLSEKAYSGLELWRENNCQTCHQLYGQGGHIGPDLTNVTARLSSHAIQAIVNSGPKQMPAFHLNQSQTESLVFFFNEMNQTGRWPAPAHDNLDWNNLPWFEVK